MDSFHRFALRVQCDCNNAVTGAQDHLSRCIPRHPTRHRHLL